MTVLSLVNQQNTVKMAILAMHWVQRCTRMNTLCRSKGSASRPSKHLMSLQLTTHPLWRHMHVLLAARHSVTVNRLEEER